MCIYDSQVLSERTIQNFLPTRLAIKELEGKLYFCKSTGQDFLKYSGSGVVWKKRIKKYGKENIKTLWISDWYHDPSEIQEIALHFSKENQIVESDRWDNLKPENGLDGGMDKNTAKKISATPTSKENKKRAQNDTVHKNKMKEKIKDFWSKPENKKRMLESQSKSRQKTIQTMSTLEYRETKRGKNAYNYDHTIYLFINTSGLVESLTRADFIKKYKHHAGAVSDMINGKVKSVKGWRLIRN